ncbi:Hypothetical predicted protein [Octopus vulgaris]|uniref:Uncharacterized protein n=1 Tax=Octopus vulgaris TaxID=6645 RepID=A0AA36B9W1_OCTVU|nr:Hypothetical predicted protein [Octopus vulgaris]
MALLRCLISKKYLMSGKYLISVKYLMSDKYLISVKCLMSDKYLISGKYLMSDSTYLESKKKRSNIPTSTMIPVPTQISVPTTPASNEEMPSGEDSFKSISFEDNVYLGASGKSPTGSRRKS